MSWSPSSTPRPRPSRRTLLSWGGLTVAWAALPLSPWRPGPRRTPDFERFVGDWQTLAQATLAGEHPAEEEYLYTLAGRAAALDLGAIPPRRFTAFHNERLETGPAWFEEDLAVIVLTLAPGAVLRPHNHPGQAVLTLCLEGSARYEHHELAGTAPPSADRQTSFELRRTRRGVLVPGLHTHLSRSRDNIHSFVAGPDGALLADVTVTLAKLDFGMLALGPEPSDPFTGLRQAHWTEKEF